MSWYPLTSIVLLSIIVLFMPKKMTWREIYLTFGIIGVLTWMSESFIDDIYQAFQLGPSPKTSITDFLFVSFVPECIGIIFLNFLPKEESWFYRFSWVIGSFLFEWGTVASGYMINKWWRNWYSIPVYLVIFLFFLPWHLQFMRRQPEVNKSKERQHISFTQSLRIRRKAR
jgi:hypothetical protein